MPKKLRFENIRLTLDYDVCQHAQYRPGERGTYSEEMAPHVEANGELILGGVSRTPNEHLADFLNRTLTLRQDVARIDRTGSSVYYYDILVENQT